MKVIVLKSPDNGRFHFGVASPDADIALSQTSDRLHSDTLFSALVVLCNKVFPNKVEGLIDSFKEGAVSVSSCSYCLDFYIDGNFGRRIYFLPKPVHFDWYQDPNLGRKYVSRVKFISKTIWENGLTPSEWRDSGCFIVGKHFLLHPSDIQKEFGDELDTIYQMQTVPKIADRVRKPENNIFFQTDLVLPKTTLGKSTLQSIGFEDINSFSAQPHFYFLLDFEKADQPTKNLIELLIELLPDEGIGGGISSGSGQVAAIENIDCGWTPEEKGQKKVEFILNNKASETEMMTLSLTSPKSGMTKEDLLAGTLITRGGRRTVFDGRLSRVRMVREGAIVTERFDGQIVPIHPTKDFLRYGKAFKISIPEKFETTSIWLTERMQ